MSAKLGKLLWSSVVIFLISLSVLVVTNWMRSVDFRHAENADIKQVKEYVYGPKGYYSTQFAGVFYAGSENEFDYAAIKTGNNVKVFKLKRGELGLKQQMKIEPNDKKWANITDMFPFSQ